VLTPLGVGQLDLVARGERAAALSDHARQVSGRKPATTRGHRLPSRSGAACHHARAKA
jgi:hypothetical protein